MNKSTTLFLVLLRISLGWYFLYQGIASILDKSWTVVPYIKGAHTFPNFYKIFLDPAFLSYTDYIVQALFIIIGLSLVLGLFVRITALVGAGVMLFFYFPLLTFPYVTSGSYVVDYHIVYAIALVYLFLVRAGDYGSLGSRFR